MNEPIETLIKQELRAAGAVAVGYARAEHVPQEVWSTYEHWLEDGLNGALGYMHNHPELRRDPRLLMPGTRTIICIAWPYLPPMLRAASAPFIARYAYGADYHKNIRRILKPIIKRWEEEYEIHSRVCIDSAPVLERYWAVQSGVGFIGRNGCLIVPGYGSWVFLTEILVDRELGEDNPNRSHCADCSACLKMCPTGALGSDGHIDCSKCLSALTIETPGVSLPHDVDFRPLAGCDRCQEVCPHNKGSHPTTIREFATIPAILSLTADELETMTDDVFRARFAGTSLFRPGLKGLLANLHSRNR
ncbi:MAG: tRNA epoxyqueuosine(34) reductase QueG [Muribaculaceae bacterium]|nr:tRNA epoxyqueuosine(34) reductase QueG [Muribaculaceae bacterium]